jgi:Flp pilus assembly protein TadG
MMHQCTKAFRMRSSSRIPHTNVVSLLRAKDEEGSSLVEFALIFLVMMAMMLGIIDFCRAAYSYHFVSEAAREATRWAAVNGATCGPPPAGDNSCNGTAPMNNGPATETDIQTYVTNLTPPGIDSTKITTTATWPVQANGPTVCSTTKNEPGCTVDVNVTYTFSFIFPLVYKVFSSTGTITLSSSSEMIIVH